MQAKTMIFLVIACCISMPCTGKTIKGNGTIITKQVAVDEFSAIMMEPHIVGSSNSWFEQFSDKELPIYEFFYEQNKTSTLLFSIDENLIPYVKVNTVNGELFISTPNKEILIPTSLKIIGTSKRLKKIKMSGDVNFIVNSKFVAENMEIISQKGSDITLRYEALIKNCVASAEKEGKIAFNELTCDSISCKASKSSDIKVMGKAISAYFEASGESDIRANRFLVNQLDCTAKGSSNLFIYVSQSLKGSAKSNSSIRYRGNPQTNMKISRSCDFSQEQY